MQRPAEGLRRVGDEGEPVPRLNLGEATQDHDVPHCALGGLDIVLRCLLLLLSLLMIILLIMLIVLIILILILVATLRDDTDGDERAGRAPGARHHQRQARRAKAAILLPSDLRCRQGSDGVSRPLGRPLLLLRLVAALREARQKATEHGDLG